MKAHYFQFIAKKKTLIFVQKQMNMQGFPQQIVKLRLLCQTTKLMICFGWQISGCQIRPRTKSGLGP